MFGSALGSQFNITETLVKAAPMIFTGLAVAVAFRAKFWNIGAEGQLMAGAVAAAFVGAYPMPGPLAMLAMALAGAAAGGLVALVPALLRVNLKVDDVVSSLLLNSVVYFAIMALIEGPWKDPFSGYPISPPIEDSAGFPKLIEGTRLHLGVLAAFIAAGLVWFLHRRAPRSASRSASPARTPRPRAMAASPSARVIVVTALISGGLAGLAGVGEVGGVHFQVMSDLSPGFGYSGIVIAMLARLNPLGVVPAAIFLAIVMTGAEAMSRATGVPVFLADVLQGTALLAMLVALLFTSYRIRRVGAAGMSDILDQIMQVGFLAAILRIATPLVFATLGEMFSERAGVLNLGIEGIMLISAMTGFSAAYYSGNLWIGVAAAVLTGAAFGFLHAVLTVALGLSQHVAGIGLTLFSTGPRLLPVPADLRPAGRSRPASSASPRCRSRCCPEIPILGPILFNQFTLVYIAILAVPLAAFVLYRTPWGLALRMAGENPRAADSAGVSVDHNALPGGGARRRADGAWPAPSCRWRSSTPSPSASSPGAAGSPSRWWCSAAGTRGAAPVRRCCLRPSTRCNCACRRAASATSPTRSSWCCRSCLTIVAMALVSRNAVAPAALLKPFRKEER